MKDLTKQLLAQTLMRMLQTQPIGKITVKHLVEECGVNRQTFYYHFHDIYDLMEWALVSGLVEYAREQGVEQGGNLSLGERIDLIYRYLYQQKAVISHAYDMTNRAQYERFLAERVRVAIDTKLDSYNSVEKLKPDQREFLIDAFTTIGVGIFLRWIEMGMPDEYQVHLKYYTELVGDTLQYSIDRFVAGNEG